MRRILIVVIIGLALMNTLLADITTAAIGPIGPAAAQRGRVEGTVLDPKGARVAQAKVTLTDAAGKAVSQTQTDGDGRFTFPDVADGRYSITVEASGFSKASTSQVEVKSGKSEALTVRLEIAAVTERLDVSGTDPVYTGMRAAKLSGQYASVKNLVLKRDIATITLKDGQVYFLAPVEGKVTGAVFIGDGEIQVNPVMALEKRHLGILTGSPSLAEQFSKLVLRFTDSTYDEIKKQFEPQAGQMNASAQDAFEDFRKLMRRGRNYTNFSFAAFLLRSNVDARMLIDLTWPGHEGMFQAFFNGKRHGDWLYAVDPLGAPFVTPEEVILANLSDSNLGIWIASHITEHYKTPAVFSENHSLIDIQHQKIEAAVKGKRLDAVVQTRFIATVDGPKVIPFDMFPTLRIRKVSDGQGRELRFIQEKKDEDADFYVILAEPVKKGQEYTLSFEYGGDDAVTDSGGGNYTLNAGARSSWYPNSSLGDRATYEITFKTPKDLIMVATGQPVGERQEGDYLVTQWKSDVPLAVAGFNFGRFKKNAVRDDKINYAIESYANKEIPDVFKSLQQRIEAAEAAGERTDTTLGALNTVSMMDKARAEAQIAMSMYSDLFGPLPYGRIAMTQQPYPNFGQAWPMLVYMPIVAYLDSTYKHQLGINSGDTFFKILGPHEVAHQWWGHIIGWKSYRDQWMSEGFADFSASMFAQAVYKNDLFIKFWKEQRELITQKNEQGKRPSDVGGVYMGYRLDTARTGSITRRVIYPKGGFILHMIRMLMWDPKTGDQKFSAMMKDFVKTFHNQNVSTQDFQSIVEKHILPDMDMDGNGKMNWFFSQWVYGTAIPDYKLDYRVEAGEGGKSILKFKVTQSNVDDSFKMRVPIYLDFDGKVRRLGTVPVTGNTTTEEFTVPLPSKPKRVILAYYEDVLCTTDNR
jgi:carboxypeptidase family protein/peptidase M1-like protein